MSRLATAVLALSAVLALTGAAPATSLPDVEDEVMCTTCRVPLNIAEAPQADRERAFIRTRIAAGDTKEEVKAAMVAEYGRDVLALPEQDGIGRAAYLVPLLAGIGAVALLALLLPRWRRTPAPAAGAGAGDARATPRELERLDRELAGGR